ncbi:winged helix DNA-binding protein [Dechloromonas sp. TW-R-39-2]|uniref:winged helix DNA-binding protein n=1 Tax=Dechloromonas sp. TW-R-39-2 TaxID=2654218 RepID=UPI00193CB052|nr:winged helix DNA-binding protein [Dechloromonas sp. TW-R-39-2]QRM18385.1 winged helix DNA-binding protein [Dechloromonas sp. TW-R-39-2]
MKSKAKTPAVEPRPALAQPGQRIVSSSHLVSEKSPELSEFEFGLIIAAHAFNRWLIRCMGAAGVKDMAPVDVLVLHHINHRRSEKRLADICFVLNIEDTHVVTYSVKKLVGMGLVSSTKRGKEAFFSTTEEGAELCMQYREVREACLMPGFSGAEEENQRLGEVARLLRTVSGRYDQAARAATSY